MVKSVQNTETSICRNDRTVKSNFFGSKVLDKIKKYKRTDQCIACNLHMYRNGFTKCSRNLLCENCIQFNVCCTKTFKLLNDIKTSTNNVTCTRCQRNGPKKRGNQKKCCMIYKSVRIFIKSRALFENTHMMGKSATKILLSMIPQIQTNCDSQSPDGCDIQIASFNPRQISQLVDIFFFKLKNQFQMTALPLHVVFHEFYVDQIGKIFNQEKL